MKPKVGDVAEIKTPQGLAYVQYTYDGKGDGEIVRVLPGLYNSRPNLEALVLQRELYFIFYTLEYAMRKRQVEIVCNLPVPEWDRSEPLMRHASGRTREGNVTGWRIVPALNPLTVDSLIRTPVIRELTQEQTGLSIRQIWPHPVMVKELARGWTPECAGSLEDQDRAASRARRADQQSGPATEGGSSPGSGRKSALRQFRRVGGPGSGSRLEMSEMPVNRPDHRIDECLGDFA